MIRPMTGKESEKMKMHIRRILPAALALVLGGCSVSGEESGSNSFYDTSAAGADSALTSVPLGSEAPAPAESEESRLPEFFAQSGFDDVIAGLAPDSVDTAFDGKCIIQKGNVNGEDYTFTVDLSDWQQGTSPSQIAALCRLFWYSYPKMHDRFGDISGASDDVTLYIVNSGYEVAYAEKNEIWLHDTYLQQNENDYDCITHELAHVLQDKWLDEYLEYSGYIERFADYCRYIYAYDGGYYNDTVWELQDIFEETDRESSVRFFVWLDSRTQTDIIKKFFKVCNNREYETADWGSAWAQIFAGTEFDGMTADEVWQMYADDDFAYYFSGAESFGEKSELI